MSDPIPGFSRDKSPFQDRTDVPSASTTPGASDEKDPKQFKECKSSGSERFLKTCLQGLNAARPERIVRDCMSFARSASWLANVLSKDFKLVADFPDKPRSLPT
jgi:hypothetical protein